MFKVKKEILLIVAGVVWFLAGANILRIGIASFVTVMKSGETLPIVLSWVFAPIVLTGFLFMFRKVVNKHAKRILSYEDKKSVFLFFDLKGYLLMGFMMALGITLRQFKAIPVAFFAAFYSGLGIALAIGGIRFFLHRLKQKPPAEKGCTF